MRVLTFFFICCTLSPDIVWTVKASILTVRYNKVKTYIFATWLLTHKGKTYERYKYPLCIAEEAQLHYLTSLTAIVVLDASCDTWHYLGDVIHVLFLKLLLLLPLGPYDGFDCSPYAHCNGTHTGREQGDLHLIGEEFSGPREYSKKLKNTSIQHRKFHIWTNVNKTLL